MSGYLEDLCTERGIQLEYTRGKFLELQEYVDKDLSNIKVNRIFEGCPQNVAKAIWTCYTEQVIESEAINSIEEYLRDSLGLSNVKIEVPSARLYKRKSGAGSQSVPDKDGYVEANISKIGVKDMWGDQRSFKKDDTLVPYEDDVLELNIVVEPPAT